MALPPSQNNKDYFDQSLDEIKLLRYVNAADPGDRHGILRLYDYFYYRVGAAVSPSSVRCLLWLLPTSCPDC